MEAAMARVPAEPPDGADQGIAGGPGPTPPGFDDGTPLVVPAQPETPPQREGAERERGDREEPYPS